MRKRRKVIRGLVGRLVFMLAGVCLGVLLVSVGGNGKTAETMVELDGSMCRAHRRRLQVIDARQLILLQGLIGTEEKVKEVSKLVEEFYSKKKR